MGLAAVMDLVLEQVRQDAREAANGCSGAKKRPASRLGGCPRALRSSRST